jgi:hypothetical protein
MEETKTNHFNVIKSFQGDFMIGVDTVDRILSVNLHCKQTQRRHVVYISPNRLLIEPSTLMTQPLQN